MEKKRLFKIMSKLSCSKLEDLSEKISNLESVLVVKEPAKTLAMIKMRDPVKNSLFYIGEVMVSEAIVEINGIKGMAVTMGDNFEKALYMAIIDCGFNNGLHIMGEIKRSLVSYENSQIKKVEKENALHLKTKVNFNTMTGGEL